MKATAGRDISVGGPDLAAQAIEAGLVDEFHLFVSPIVVGGGNRALPDGVRLELELLEERRFATASSTSTTSSRRRPLTCSHYQDLDVRRSGLRPARAMRMIVFNASSALRRYFFSQEPVEAGGPSLAGSRRAVPWSTSVWIFPWKSQPATRMRGSRRIRFTFHVSAALQTQPAAVVADGPDGGGDGCPRPRLNVVRLICFSRASAAASMPVRPYGSTLRAWRL